MGPFFQDFPRPNSKKVRVVTTAAEGSYTQLLFIFRVPKGPPFATSAIGNYGLCSSTSGLIHAPSLAQSSGPAYEIWITFVVAVGFLNKGQT